MNVNEMLKAYVDGELTPAERDAVEVAASKDPAVRAEIEWLQSFSNTLKKSVPPFEIRGKNETLAALRNKKPAQIKTGIWLGGLSMAAVAGIAFFALNQKSDFGRLADSKMVAMETSAPPVASSILQDAKSQNKSKEASAPSSRVETVQPGSGPDKTSDTQSLPKRDSPHNTRRVSKKSAIADQYSFQPNRSLVAPVKAQDDPRAETPEVFTIEVDDPAIAEANLTEVMRKAGFGVQKPGNDSNTVVLVIPEARIEEARALLKPAGGPSPDKTKKWVAPPPGAGLADNPSKLSMSPGSSPAGGLGGGMVRGGMGDSMPKAGRAGRGGAAANQSEALGTGKSANSADRKEKVESALDSPRTSGKSGSPGGGGGGFYGGAKGDTAKPEGTVQSLSARSNADFSISAKPQEGSKRKLFIIKFKAKPKSEPVNSKGGEPVRN